MEFAEFFVCDLAVTAFDQVLGLGVSSFSDTESMLHILGTQRFEFAGNGFDVHAANEKGRYLRFGLDRVPYLLSRPS